VSSIPAAPLATAAAPARATQIAFHLAAAKPRAELLFRSNERECVRDAVFFPHGESETVAQPAAT